MLGDRGFQKIELVILIIATIICLFFIYRCHFIRESETYYTHLCYLPIAIGALLWGKRAVYLAVFLAMNLWGSHYFSGVHYPITDDLLRGAVFIIISLILGWIVDKRGKIQQDLWQEREERHKEMEAHLNYVNKVAHELRNPLQVALGMLDALETERFDERQKKIIDVLDGSVEKMRKKIKELTNDN